MFEHYGFMDVLYGIKKYIALILLVSIVFAGMGVVLAMAKNDVLAKDFFEPNNDAEVSVSELYIISYNGEDNSTVSKLQKDKETAALLSSMMNSQFIRLRVFEQIFNEYKIEDIISESAELKKAYDNAIEKDAFMLQFVNIETIKDTSIIRVYVHAYEEAFAGRVLELYREQLEKYIDKLKETGMDCAYSTIADTKVGLEAIENAPVQTEVSKVKYAVIFAFFGGAVSVCFVFLYTLFFPTVNRRSDAEKYGVASIGDKGEGVEFFAYKIKKQVGEGANVALVIGKSACEERRADAFIKKLSTVSDELIGGIKFIKVKDPDGNFASFKEAVGCDAVVMCISYSCTKHTEYQKNLSRLYGEDIKPVGYVVI